MHSRKSYITELVTPSEPLIPEKIIPGGQALATAASGKKVFLWNALPGESVTEYQITKQKSHYLEAIATKITHSSPHRITPKDPCYLSTSPWQIIDYPHELIQKQSLIQEIFREHKITLPPPAIITDNHDYFYRNKMEYSLYWNHDTQKIDLAFHARGSHRKIPIQKSSLERPEIFQAAQEIVADLNSAHVEARRYQSLLLRCSQHGEVSGGLYENHQPHPNFTPLKDTILDHTYRYSPNGFFQINLPVYELALKEIRRHIETNNVLDLYSGVGTIGLSVANDKHLTLVESDKFAFRELLQNLKSYNPNFNQNTDNLSSLTLKTSSGTLSAHLAKSEHALDFITTDTTVILDPPRAGCHPDLIAKLLAVVPKTIIYLSCNPATQARDIALLQNFYRLETIKAYNFFPRTPHIENLVVLTSIL